MLYEHFIPLKGLGIIFNYFQKYSDVLTCDAITIFAGGGIIKVTHGQVTHLKGHDKASSVSSNNRSRISFHVLLGFHFLVQVPDELSEDEGVNVLAKLVKQEPVSYPGFAAHGFNLI